MKRRHEVPEVRFWRKVDLGGDHPRGCWVWTGLRSALGYGRFVEGAGTHWFAHRFAWSLVNGAPDVGKVICHRCDNPSCVNPAHLFMGTQGDNIRDAASKGRVRLPMLRGEQHPNSKATDSRVCDARRAFAAGSSKAEITRMLGLSKKTVTSLLTGSTWSHVRDNE